MKSFYLVFTRKDPFYAKFGLKAHLKHLMLLSFLLFYGQQLIAQQQYLKASLSNSINVEAESYIHLGKIQANLLELEAIPIGTDGYIDFSFSGLTSSDHVNVSLQNASGSIYYKMQFVNNTVKLVDQVGTNYTLSGNTSNNSRFKIKKCGKTITWSENPATPLFHSTLPNEEVLFAQIRLNAASNVSLSLTFDTDNNGTCEKCPTTGGKALFPGDVMFAAYNNASTGNQIAIKTLTTLTNGTSFSLLQGYHNASNNNWFSPTNNGSTAIQKITYTGNFLASGATICFTLATSGTGTALLASNFSINGNASNDFCVENVGNTVNPQINLTSNAASALFLAQGNWKLLDAHNEFAGRVLSALQYGGNFTNQAPQNGLSNIPSDLECMAIEDGLNPANRHAYFSTSSLTVGAITNFFNWTVGSGALPSAVCGNAASIVESEVRSKTLSISENTAHLYPNPFQNSFNIQLDLVKDESVLIDIYDSNGRRILSKNLSDLQAGQHIIPITFSNPLSNAVLWTRIQLADEIIIKRIVQQDIQ